MQAPVSNQHILHILSVTGSGERPPPYSITPALTRPSCLSSRFPDPAKCSLGPRSPSSNHSDTLDIFCFLRHSSKNNFSIPKASVSSTASWIIQYKHLNEACWISIYPYWVSPQYHQCDSLPVPTAAFPEGVIPETPPGLRAFLCVITFPWPLSSISPIEIMTSLGLHSAACNLGSSSWSFFSVVHPVSFIVTLLHHFIVFFCIIIMNVHTILPWLGYNHFGAFCLFIFLAAKLVRIQWDKK